MHQVKPPNLLQPNGAVVVLVITDVTASPLRAL